MRIREDVRYSGQWEDKGRRLAHNPQKLHEELQALFQMKYFQCKVWFHLQVGMNGGAVSREDKNTKSNKVHVRCIPTFKS